MAEENVNNEEEVREEVNKEEKEEKKEKKRKLPPIKSLLFWGVTFIVLIIGAYLLVEKVVAPSINIKKMNISSKVSGGKGEIKKIIYPLEPLVVNLADQGARRYLKITINLELDRPEVIKETETLKPCLIDSLITLLSSKTLADIETAKEKISLRREIVTSFNEQLTTGRITNVYFTEFIIQ